MTRRAAPAVLLVALMVAVAGCEDFRAGRLMRQANELGAQGRWTEALHYYERLWVQFPSSGLVDEAKFRAARIYAGPEQKPRSAEDIYRQLVLRGRDEEVRVRALLELADLYVERGDDTDKAIEVLEAYLQRFPGHEHQPRAALRLARLYLEQGQFFQAIQEAKPLVSAVEREQRAGALLVMAQAQEYGHYLEQARETYGDVLAVADRGDPRWIAAQEGRIRVLEELGRWQEALDGLAELRPRHPNPDAVERWLVAIQERHEEMGR